MLRDAALLQLELVRRALDEDLILKDSSSYNVQWNGAQPVFIDVGSFERLRAGEPWAGYRQFCMLFLNPLLLQAYKGVDFRPLLRGSLAGITPAEARRFFSFRDLFRRGVMTNVALHARLERKHETTRARREDRVEARRLQKELIVANVRRLEKLVRRLEWEPGSTEWSGYGATTSYDEADAARKEEFVREVVHTREWGLVWDIGCNEGRHSRIAAENARYVVALDADAAVVDRLYRSLAAEQARRRSCRSSPTSPTPRRRSAGRGSSARRSRGAAGRSSRSASPCCTTSRSAGTCPCRSSCRGSRSSARRS